MADADTLSDVKPDVTDTKDFEVEQHNPQDRGGQNFRGGPNRRGAGRFRGNSGQRRNEPYNRQRGGQGGPSYQKREDGGQGENRYHQYQQGPRTQEEKINEKLSQMGGPTYDLPAIDLAEKKFNCRTRLYIGNIDGEAEESELKELFAPYGETGDFFLNKEKNFAFIKFDYRSNAEKAKRELDGTLFRNRNLKIRFSPNGSTVKVKNLSFYVSNELLYHAFQVFGDVERAYIVVDERGKPTGEGIVEFARKNQALNVIRMCSENCFFLTGSLRPCVVESYEVVEETDGNPEKSLPKRHPEYIKQREVGPRFASSGSFEDQYGLRWKQIYELYAQKEQALKKEFEMQKEKLEAEMEYTRYEHETEMLRQKLQAREMAKERQKQELEMKERLAQEEREKMEEQMRRYQEEMKTRYSTRDDEMTRRRQHQKQESDLFMQAHELDSLLNQQEIGYERSEGGTASLLRTGTAQLGYDRFGVDKVESRAAGPRDGAGDAGGHWVDEFPQKRRRVFL